MGLFTVLTRGRTGSTALVAAINQHPDIICHQELFRTAPAVTYDDMLPAYEAVKEAGRTPLAEEYLREVEATGSPRKVGFKLLDIHLEQRRDIGLEQFVLNSSQPIILLTREPAFAALSAAIAQTRGVYNLPVAHEDDDLRARMKVPVRLDADSVAIEARLYREWSERWQTRLSDLGTRNIAVTYEQFVADRLGLLNRIFRFLEVSELQELAPNPYEKVTSEDVWDDVLNAAEVRAALSAAPKRRRRWRSFFSRR